MAMQIQLRRGTAATWTSVNPVLAQGEVGLETDTGLLKVGDGSTAWTGLSYFTGATKVFVQSSQPSTLLQGNLWLDTSSTV